jgi:hypothetical protein
MLTRDEGDRATARALHAESLLLRQEIGNETAIAASLESLESLATIALAEGEPERAARLLAAAATLRSATRTPRLPQDRAQHEQDIANARSALGDDAFAAAWATGEAMPVAEAIADALGVR